MPSINNNLLSMFLFTVVFIFASLKMTYNCAICYEDFEQKTNNHFKCQYCDYYYCADCLEDYINNFKFKPTIFPQLTCPNCDNIISYDLILSIVSERTLNNLLNKVRETIRENSKFLYVKIPQRTLGENNPKVLE